MPPEPMRVEALRNYLAAYPPEAVVVVAAEQYDPVDDIEVDIRRVTYTRGIVRLEVSRA